MQRGPPVTKLRFHGNDRVVIRARNDVSTATLVVELGCYSYGAPW